MRWLISFRDAIRRRFASARDWLAQRFGQPAPGVRFELVEEFPDGLKASTLYVAGQAPHWWGAAMLCPCGCKDVIELNLLEQAKPCWTVTLHDEGVASLTPSVWRKKGCQSHFFLRRGRIDWCPTNSAPALEQHTRR